MMLRVQCYACKGTGENSLDVVRLCGICHGRGILRLFPTPLEALIQKRTAIDETLDQAGL